MFDALLSLAFSGYCNWHSLLLPSAARLGVTLWIYWRLSSQRWVQGFGPFLFSFLYLLLPCSCFLYAYVIPGIADHPVRTSPLIYVLFVLGLYGQKRVSG
jgi:hypothetical protein